MNDRPVLVVDLTTDALAADRHALVTGDVPPRPPPDEALGPDERVERVAVLHDGEGSPLLLPIAPTRDRARLDAIGRLLRFAVLRGERIPVVATKYGGEAERRLAFARELPAWAYEGVDAATLKGVPEPLRRVLRRPDRA